MIKSLSPYYLYISFRSPLTLEICTAYTLQIFVWDGVKNSPPLTPSYSTTKQNPSSSSGLDKVNIARLLNDYIDFTAQTMTTTGLYDANNQRWVKTQIIYTTENELDLNVVQLPTTNLMVQGYGYGLDGENSQVPINKILLSGGEFKVNRNGFFNLPIIVDEPASTLSAVDESIDIYFQDTILNVLSNDNLGFEPTIIKSIITEMPASVGVLSIEGNAVKFTKGTAIETPQTFTYTIQDSLNNESTATVTINIFIVPNLPIASNNSYSTNSSSIIDLLVLNNDALGTTPTTITSVDVTGFGLGSIAISGGNKLVFTPNGTTGTDTFTYTITDSVMETSTATVTITVNSVVTSSYYYTGVYEEGDELHPAGGTVTYINSSGNTQSATLLFSNECRLITAQSIISTVGAAPCIP